MKKLLITGASGFLGRGCLDALAARAWEVHAVVRSPLDVPGIHVQQADLLRPAEASAILAKIQPTHLLHLAWITAPATFRESVENLRWVEASQHLLRAFAEQGGRRVVMVGSCFEYDPQAGCCHETTTPLRPATLYGVCKNALRASMESYAETMGLSAAWARLFYLYGPREAPQRLVASVTRKLLAGTPVSCPGGTQQRDYLHVEDASGALIALLESDLCGAVNIGSGEATEVRAIMERIAHFAGRPELVHVDDTPSEVPLVVADVHRLREELGWRPRLGLNEGLAQTIDWWRSRR